jgi:chromate transport protein ChrA
MATSKSFIFVHGIIILLLGKFIFKIIESIATKHTIGRSLVIIIEIISIKVHWFHIILILLTIKVCWLGFKLSNWCLLLPFLFAVT